MITAEKAQIQSLINHKKLEKELDIEKQKPVEKWGHKIITDIEKAINTAISLGQFQCSVQINPSSLSSNISIELSRSDMLVQYFKDNGFQAKHFHKCEYIILNISWLREE